MNLKRSLILLACTACTLTTATAEAPPYLLDQSFGFQGAFGFQGVNYRGNIRFIATDGESKAIAIGNMGGWNATDGSVFFVGLDLSGNPIPSFGNRGDGFLEITTIGTQGPEAARLVEDRLYLAYHSADWRLRSIAVFDSNSGNLLTDWGDDGVVTYDQDPHTHHFLKFLSDGSSLLVSNQEQANGDTSFRLKKLGVDGRIDNDFGENGIYTPTIPDRVLGDPEQTHPRAVAESPDGKITVTYNSFALRLNAEGTTDLSFGDRGWIDFASLTYPDELASGPLTSVVALSKPHVFSGGGIRFILQTNHQDWVEGLSRQHFLVDFDQHGVPSDRRLGNMPFPWPAGLAGPADYTYAEFLPNGYLFLSGRFGNGRPVPYDVITQVDIIGNVVPIYSGGGGGASPLGGSSSFFITGHNAGEANGKTLKVRRFNPPPDSDSDGLADYLETHFSTDPNDPDSDDDGLNDWGKLLGGQLTL